MLQSLGCRVDLTSCVSVDPTAPVPECIAPMTPPSLPEDPIPVESQSVIASDVTPLDAALNDRQTDTGDVDGVKRAIRNPHCREFS